MALEQQHQEKQEEKERQSQRSWKCGAADVQAVVATATDMMRGTLGFLENADGATSRRSDGSAQLAGYIGLASMTTIHTMNAADGLWLVCA